ncbi:MAG: peptidoglycan DD-metalloendopeptidase family protein [bacterium]|nr:peptidoglycan DD-metalloendopeptidase family protein [bacterium]
MKTKRRIKFLLVLAALIFALPSNTVGQSGTSGSISDEITALNEEIRDRQKDIDAIQEKQEYYKKEIRAKKDEQATLKNQISVLDSTISNTELKIEETQIDIDKTALEVKKVLLEIEAMEDDIAKKKDYLEKLLRKIAQYDDVNTLEALLVNKSLSEFLDQIQYIKDVNGSLGEVLDEVKLQKVDLEEKEVDLEKKKSELGDLKKELEERRAEIEDQKINKQYILDTTKQSEGEYQNLLNKAKAEQERANAEIVNFEREIRKKLAEQQGKDKLQFNDNGFIWPVPKNVVTAYFHDPDYPYRYIFEHPAVDIRAGQGTPIRAAASGYVAQAKDNGYGYSYIMIVHGDGLSTVYGHVSRIDVKLDEFVAQGQIIGASGGMPGTKGAGYLTSGPHLHFETRLNGIPVNPLNYLP